MTDFTRRNALAAIAAAALAGCADTDLAGGKKTPKGGIGGTGIVGTVTDLGSIILNGVRVATPDGLAVGTAFEAVALNALGIGDQVTVEAATEDGALVAKRIHLAHPAIGRLAVTKGGFRVAGALVIPEPNAVIAASAGDRVAVSGVWQGDRIVASRIAKFAAPADAISGTLRRTPQGWTIGNVRVSVPVQSAPQGGGFATATGKISRGVFQAETLVQGRFTGAAGPLVALSVEGYLAPTPAAPFHTVDGLGHSFAPDTDLEPYRMTRTLFQGGYDGTFVLQRGLKLAEDLNERRAQLRP